MREKRNVVFGFKGLSRGSESLVNVSLAANDLCRVARSFLQLLFILIRIVSFVGTVVPVDLQFLAPLKSSPGAIRQHGNAAQRLECRRGLEGIDDNGLRYAPDFQSISIVD